VSTRRHHRLSLIVDTIGVGGRAGSPGTRAVTYRDFGVDGLHVDTTRGARDRPQVRRAPSCARSATSR
jgi:hypothetical protein